MFCVRLRLVGNTEVIMTYDSFYAAGILRLYQ